MHGTRGKLVPATERREAPSAGSVSHSYTSWVGQKLYEWTGLRQIAEEAKEDKCRAPVPLPNETNPLQEMIAGILKHPEQVQALMNYNELSYLVGQPENNYLKDSLSDFVSGSKKLVWYAPQETIGHWLSAGRHLCRERGNAIRCVYQYLLPKHPSELVRNEQDN